MTEQYVAMEFPKQVLPEVWQPDIIWLENDKKKSVLNGFFPALRGSCSVVSFMAESAPRR